MKNYPYAIPFVIFGLFLLTTCTNKESNDQKPESYSFSRGVVIAHWADFLFEGRTYGDPEWFGEDDVKWLSDQGFDHIQVRVEGALITNKDQTLNKEKISLLDSAIKWAEKEKMGVVFNLMSFPDFELDSTLAEAQLKEIEYEKRLDYWRQVTEHFKPYRHNVRLILFEYPPDLAANAIDYNAIVQRAFEQIRLIDTERHFYVPIYSWKQMNDFRLPEKSGAVSIAFSLPSVQLFGMQHAKPWFFPNNYPRITFPANLPDLKPFLPENATALAYSEKRLDENVIGDDFKLLKNTLKKNEVKFSDLYIMNWGYYIGYPLQPEAVEDTVSISNYGQAMATQTKGNNINWSLYDYNSGMAIRDSTGTPSVLLSSLKLGKRK